MIDTKGVMQMPKEPQENLAEGAKHGYIGEDTKEVKTYEKPEAGSSNTVPDVGQAEANVAAAEVALEKAQRTLAEAKQAASKKKAENKTQDKPPVGAASTPPAGDKTPNP